MISQNEDKLRYKPNIMSLGEDQNGAKNEVEDMRSDDDSDEVNMAEQSESEIEDDMLLDKQQKKAPKK